jgi:hypothetical protein
MYDWFEEKFVMLGTIVTVALGCMFSVLPIWY